MAEKPAEEAQQQKVKEPGGTPAADAPAAQAPRARGASWLVLRREVPRWQAVCFGLLSLAVCGGIWWFLTLGEVKEERMVSPGILPSPQETFADFHSLWFDRALTRNTCASLRRVALGFGLAVAVGVPLGVLCGCFPWLGAFFAPLTIVGRNIPIAALIPLTFSFFGIGEFQKTMFIFIACVAFIIGDTITAIADVSSRYIDTAYTLGANRRQIIIKVLVPLALPAVFNSLRLLFGLAFGYIMLAELIKFGDASGGLGDIINTSQKRGMQTHILLVLMIIPLVALAIDRFLFWVQRELFPYQYGGKGILRRAVGAGFRVWEGVKDGVRSLFGRPADNGPTGPPGQNAGSPASQKSA
jgi:ABC-type nitrate/sulfonate/bicarbonate transport system permease component